MSKKLITFDTDARTSLSKGVDALANAVKATLGPKGRNALIENNYGAPTVTKDGVSVAKVIHLEDPVENMGAQMVIEVASQTSDVAGDGTTTATVLAQAIFNEGLKSIAAGIEPIDIKRGIDSAVENIVAELKLIAQPVRDSKDITQVGAISANNDDTIGSLISEAMEKVGKDGIITVEESKNSETTLDVVDGIQFDRGYNSPYFVTNAEKMTAELEGAKILIYTGKINNFKEQLLPIVEKTAQAGLPLMIVAQDMDPDAQSIILTNKLSGVLKAVWIKSPGFIDEQIEMLKDLAAVTGGTVIDENLQMKVEDVKMEQLGSAKKIVVSKDTTTIIDGAGTQEDIKKRIKEIKNQIDIADSDFKKDKLQSRLAKIAGGVAILRIGAATEVEMREKKARVEDALHATRAAVEEGIVPGGGVALIRASQKCLMKNDSPSIGEKIIFNAVKTPLAQIALNAGEVGDVIVEKVSALEGNIGYNASTGKYEDLILAGVIDPVKVTRVALENAASVSTMLLMTQVAIVKKEEPKQVSQVPDMSQMYQ